MAIQTTDAAGNLSKITEHGAHRVAPYPYGTGVGLGGHYRFAKSTGIVGAGMTASSAIMAVRWDPVTNPSRLMLLTRLRMTHFYSLTGFTAGRADFFMFRRAASWSSNATGGTSYSALWAAGSQKMRASMAQSEFIVGGDVRLSTTAALTVSTGTEDTDPMASYSWFVPATGNANLLPAPYLDLFTIQSGEHPLTFASDEGFLIRATVPGTGTWTAGFEMVWAEVEAL